MRGTELGGFGSRPIALRSAGELPRDAAGRLLNLDFETGTLDNWTASGEAFAGQPVKGDTVTARGRGMKSEHAGRYWVGGYEVSLSDEPQGTLTSAPFKVTAAVRQFPHCRRFGSRARASSWCAATRTR